jgi:hypothetical protein
LSTGGIPGTPLSQRPQMRNGASENDGTDHFILITPTASSDSNSTFVTS